jgi:hypothetical protein
MPANRDINPAEDLAVAYPALRPLIFNEPIAQAFAEQEDAANFWKQMYQASGNTALICIFIAMIVFDYQVTLQSHYGAPRALAPLSALLVAIGLAAQLVLMIGKIKDRWLASRFAAERIRCLKFQAFGVIGTAVTEATLAEKVAAWTSRNMADLNQELLGGRAAVVEFSPAEALVPLGPLDPRADPKLIRDASRVYDTLRISVQGQHVAEYLKKAEGRAAVPAMFSEILFGAGALLTFIQIAIASWSTLHPEQANVLSPLTDAWLAFLTLLMFVASAILAVYERGSGFEHEAERYIAYARELRRIRLLHAEEGVTPFLDSLTKMEEVALRELHDFCRDAKHSNFIF